MTQTQTRLKRTDPPQLRTATGTLPPSGDGGERPQRGCGCLPFFILIAIIGCIVWWWIG